MDSLKSGFVSYVGEPDFHDGGVSRILLTGDSAEVTVRGCSGDRYRIEFSGVQSVVAQRPHDIILYALAEFTCPPPLRLFVFANNEDEDSASLEIVASDFTISRC